MNLRHLFALVLVCGLGACAPKPQLDEAAVFKTVEDNVRAMEHKDIDGVMATVHPKSSGASSEARAEIEGIFARYDLKYTLSDMKIVSETPEEVRVRFVQKTEKSGGDADFTDFIVEGVHSLRKDGDKWKLFDIVITKTTPVKPQ